MIASNRFARWQHVPHRKVGAEQLARIARSERSRRSDDADGGSSARPEPDLADAARDAALQAHDR